ncbi:unnamed protein product [Amaranthus hypochondriacus]
MVVSNPTINQNIDYLEINPKPKPDDPTSIVEEIEGVIKLYKNGYVERSTKVMSSVSPYLDSNLQVNARDVFIDKNDNIWARIYVPRCNKNNNSLLPIMVYFHGGGFCIGSTAWKCYHDFLGKLSSQAQCVIVSVNYRLAPENPLPAAYEDGMKALIWVKQQGNIGHSREYWAKYCDFSSIFLGGDSAGANIAYNVALRHGMSNSNNIKGIVLIQPFFGGEERTNSELSSIKVQLRKSALSLAASDIYWRIALPLGANRNHPWCNPLLKDMKWLEKIRIMIYVAENDILKDRNLGFCDVLSSNLGNQVDHFISQGVGHAFQILDDSTISQNRKKEMIFNIVNFIGK